MLEVLAGWENPSKRLVPASRAGRLGAIALSRAEFYTASRRRLPCRWRIFLWVGFRVARDAEPNAWFRMQGL